MVVSPQVTSTVDSSGLVAHSRSGCSPKRRPKAARTVSSPAASSAAVSGTCAHRLRCGAAAPGDDGALTPRAADTRGPAPPLFIISTGRRDQPRRQAALAVARQAPSRRTPDSPAAPRRGAVRRSGRCTSAPCPPRRPRPGRRLRMIQAGPASSAPGVTVTRISGSAGTVLPVAPGRQENSRRAVVPRRHAVREGILPSRREQRDLRPGLRPCPRASPRQLRAISPANCPNHPSGSGRGPETGCAERRPSRAPRVRHSSSRAVMNWRIARS